MKKIVLFALILLTSFSCFSFENNKRGNTKVTVYQLENSLIGCGIGSFIQGDKKSGLLLVATDVTGVTMMAAGVVSYAFTSYIYEGLRTYAGDVTSADLWISAGVAFTGLGTFIAGRILGWNLPTRFESKKTGVAMNLFMTPSYEGITAGFKLEF